MDSDYSPILVLGGTGHYGSCIVNSLLAKNAAVRVLTRNPDKARDLLGDRPEIFSGDITARESVTEALKQVNAVMICVSAMSWGSVKHIREIERDGVLMVLEEAGKAGTERVVYTSGYEMREEVITRLRIRKLGEIKLEIEAALARSGLNWTVLGCAPSMELLFTFYRRGRLTVPGGGPPALPTISRHDVGEIAAQALLRTDLGSRRFRMTGPEALSFPEAARRIADFTGQPVKFVRIPLLPLKLAGLITRPFNPFVQYLFWSVKLLNHFPEDLAAQVPQDHALLRETFDYEPVTFDLELQRRFGRERA
ncbi:MAG: NAD(P)H-binding protein [Fidelibacterota bacterium]|nr:MAG: NAD(P)H-binding protein [Candidatus Neomarinimicrobiota bacterium]